MKPTHLFYPTFLVLLTSCYGFYFESPQPRNEKELEAVPDELIGTYLHKNSDGDDDLPELLLIITRNAYLLTGSNTIEEDEKITDTLSPGNVVLKKLDDYYVLSRKVENFANSANDSVWEVYVIENHDKHLVLYMPPSEIIRPQLIDSVKKITPVKKLEGAEGGINLINPGRKQIKKLLNNNLFSKTEFEKVK